MHKRGQPAEERGSIRAGRGEWRGKERRPASPSGSVDSGLRETFIKDTSMPARSAAGPVKLLAARAQRVILFERFSAETIGRRWDKPPWGGGWGTVRGESRRL